MTEILKVNTCIVGTGAAGYNAACRLKAFGVDDILLISENRVGGTSRNTGSDKQTYYKLSLSGSEPDSIMEMARTLFDGKAVDGDIALCEAALSTRSFMHLVESGLPFPTNRYGEYVGYKTDHDPRSRATSIGPYTSKAMTQALEKECMDLNVPFRDHLQVIRILSDGKRCEGLLCLDNSRTDEVHFVAVEAANVILATGGPAGMYGSSVYPQSQHGSSGLAFEAGVRGRNLTEWQFGLASVKPRWNVSGTYMQVLPRFVSTDSEGKDEKEFLLQYFDAPEEMLSKVFLKGYQWPFDVRKVENGSSIIDILVYMELSEGRRVFLDFTKDPANGAFRFDALDPEAFNYLSRADALLKTPIRRLEKMNQPAIEFYRDKGVDLEKDMLEIALCAQHNNGGLDLDLWWQSNVKGLFVAGEVAGSHGVYRPGGSALNAGQVGSLRAATYIAHRGRDSKSEGKTFGELLDKAVEEMTAIAVEAKDNHSNLEETEKRTTSLMSSFCGPIREEKTVRDFVDQIDGILSGFCRNVKYSDPSELKRVYKLRDNLIAQKCYALSMLDYMAQGGKSRGSALYHDDCGNKPYAFLPETFRYSLDDGSKDGLIQEMSYTEGKCAFTWRPVRPVPDEDDFFENVWREFRKDSNVR